MRTAFLALFAGLLSCQTATQITVKLRGVGVECPTGSSPTIEQTGVLAKQQLQSRADLPELSVQGEQCDEVETSVVSLGDIVLVPADGPGPVEVLALGALKVGDDAAVSAEDCRAEYKRLFGAPCEIGEGKACESCIFARRSVAFVKHSKLEITIDLDASCAGVICDPSQTCSKGVCVSAESSCSADGSCTLVNENEGGAGGEGGAPVGGEGGGGGVPDVWTTLWEPAISSCQGADPSDVIGAQIETEAGPSFHALVPAGPCMLVLEEGAPPLEHTAQGTEANDYRAVAAGANGDFIALGDRGTTRLLSTPSFAVLNPQLTSFDPNAQGVAWDIASAGTASPVAWTRSYQGDPGTSGQIVPFVTGGPVVSIFRGALFTAYPVGSGTAPIIFGAWAGNVAARRGALTHSAKVPAPPGWSLWAEELAGDAGTFQLVAVGAKTDAVYVGRCTDTAPGAEENCEFVVQPIGLVPAAPASTSHKVEAIWGLQTTTEIALYAVGDDSSVGPWLGRALIPTTGRSTPLNWTFAGLPPEMLTAVGPAIKSVWVGLTGGTGASVIVAGPAGVFRAQLDELEFLMEP